MKKLYVFSTENKETIDKWVNEDNCFICTQDEDGISDEIVVFAETSFEAFQEKEDMERIWGVTYHTMITPEGNVIEIE